MLGYPTTDGNETPTRPGRYQHFEGGSVYWSPTTQAHEVHGAIRDAWAAMGWENSSLGFPVSDEEPFTEYSDPWNPGRRSAFEYGWLTWTPRYGVRVDYNGRRQPPGTPVDYSYNGVRVEAMTAGQTTRPDSYGPLTEFDPLYTGTMRVHNESGCTVDLYSYLYLWKDGRLLNPGITSLYQSQTHLVPGARSEVLLVQSTVPPVQSTLWPTVPGPYVLQPRFVALKDCPPGP